MNLRVWFSIFAATVLMSGICSTLPAHALALRTWVSASGFDNSTCTRTFPCATLANAISVTAAGGEVDCVDAGSFGTISITKSITIDCGSGEAGSAGSILVPSGQTGIIVQAGASDIVIIRRITIDGVVGTGSGGSYGIQFQSGKSLEINGVNVMHCAVAGLNAIPNATSSLYVINSNFSDNGTSPSQVGHVFINPFSSAGLIDLVVNKVRMLGGTSGLRISDNAATTIHASVERSLAGGALAFGLSASSAGGRVTMIIDRFTASNNGTAGVQADGSNTELHIGNSLIFGNATGISATNGSTMVSYKDNDIRMNGSNGTPLTQDTLE